jgi:hypothetical protein
MKKHLSVHLKAWGVLVSVILMLFSVMTGYGHAALVAYWNFEESTGSVALDASGYGNNGNIYGATRVQGKCGSGLSFGGTSYVLVPNSASINLEVWTISCWVSFSNLDVAQVILDKRNGYQHRNYSLVYYPNESPLGGPLGDYLAALVGGGSCPSTYDCAAYKMVSFVQNQFYHLAATYDGSTLKLYLDGNLLASRTLDISGITGTGDLYIGAPGDLSGNEYLYGVLDDLRIYSHVLTDQQILADMGLCLLQPSNLSAVPMSENQINLTWTGGSTNVESFGIQRKIGSAGAYSDVATVNANVTSYNDTGLLEATTYFYRAHAHHLSLDSDSSNETSALTFPAAPSGLTATIIPPQGGHDLPVSGYQIYLTWADDSLGELGYKIWSKEGAGGTYVLLFKTAANVTHYMDKDVWPSTTYFYRVQAYNASGDSKFSNDVTATTGADSGGAGGGGGGGGGGGCFISTVERH